MTRGYLWSLSILHRSSANLMILWSSTSVIILSLLFWSATNPTSDATPDSSSFQWARASCCYQPPQEKVDQTKTKGSNPIFSEIVFIYYIWHITMQCFRMREARLTTDPKPGKAREEMIHGIPTACSLSAVHPQLEGTARMFAFSITSRQRLRKGWSKGSAKLTSCCMFSCPWPGKSGKCSAQSPWDPKNKSAAAFSLLALSQRWWSFKPNLLKLLQRQHGHSQALCAEK